MTGTLAVEVYEGEIFLIAYADNGQPMAKFHIDPQLSDALGVKLKRAAIEVERFHRTVTLN